MKTLKLIKKILFTIIGVSYYVFALCMTILLLNYNDYNVTQFGEKSLVIINDDISREEYTKGDLVIVDSVKIRELNKGDTLFAYKVDKKGNVNLEVGNVGEIYLEEEAFSFENGETYSMEFAAGKPGKVYEEIGTFLSIVESKWGFLFIVLVPCFLIFIYEVYALIVEVKYGDEEEVQEDKKDV